MQDTLYDLVICGGGLAGLTLDQRDDSREAQNASADAGLP